MSINDAGEWTPIPAPALRKVKCPHCGIILVQGDDLCCQPLRDELNALASARGRTIDELATAFNQWFEAHKVE